MRGREAGPRGAAEDSWGAEDSAHSWKNASSVVSHFPEACEKLCFCRSSLRAFPPPQLSVLKTGSGGASWECGAGKRRQCRFPAWMSGWTPEPELVPERGWPACTHTQRIRQKLTQRHLLLPKVNLAPEEGRTLNWI